MAAAIRALPADGLCESARTLARAMEGAGEQRKDYWKNRVLPFWGKLWPKSNDQVINAIAMPLACLCIAAGGEFPSALETIGNWLRPIQYADYVIHRLHETDFPGLFPEDTLRFLSAILNDQSSGLGKLRQCLEAIVQAMPNLRQDHNFMRLDEFARRFEI